MNAMLSTADTEIFLLTGLLQKEAMRLKRAGLISLDLMSVTGARILMLVVGVSAIAAAYYVSDLIELYSWLLTALLLISPAIVGSLILRTNALAMSGSILVALAIAVVGYQMSIISLGNLYLVAIPSAIVFVLLSVAFASKEET